jgi:MYXO-CTERM domain-containing protein
MNRRFAGFSNCLHATGVLRLLAPVALVMSATTAAGAATLSNKVFNVQIGGSGEISSLQIAGDAFPTNYVLNAGNAPGQDTSDHEWVGELMFTYRLGTGPWTTALTNQSADVRSVAQNGNAVTVTYANSGNPQGVKHFTLVETYSLVGDYLYWQIALTNTSGQSIEFGDVGLPLPFNEFWFGGDVIYETRTVYHSFTGQNSSYITVQRPSGVGPFLLMTPDPATGAGFEYMDAWVQSEHPGSAWAAGGGNPGWPNGLDVFYIHSNVIKSTNRGYLPNTSLTLPAGQSKTYAFKFFTVASHDDVQSRLYQEGLVDTTVVPGMMLATNMTAKVDLHTSKSIASLTAQYPSQTTITPLGTVPTDHHLYQIQFSRLGQNDVVVSYGAGETTTLQFYVLEPLDAAIQRHATFMVQSTQAANGSLAGVFDDWMMDSKARRGATGGGGWGDDWGWTHAEFLAEKNAQTPVASEVRALDDYLDAVWANAIDNASYIVQDWWCPPGTNAGNTNNCYYDRAYAYPHAFNTFFSMYKVAHLYPGLVSYHNTADTYLLRAYHILDTLYSGHGDPGTGYMGEQTLPEIVAALALNGHSAESQRVGQVLSGLHAAFQGNPYPYGSEYSYDNTGEEAVYTAAKASGDTTILGKVNAKTRACRGQEPVWYYYADPVTLNGENWWQFQYTAALAGYCMDDWLRTQSTTPEVDERLAYAAKIANLSAINSGQIDPAPQNLGAVAWTYQASKGNVYINSFDPPGSALHQGWRQMAGEADLGLFGAIRILSADIVVDPVFGLYGYGANVQQSGNCYAITPTDGVFKKLNLITQRLGVVLDRDQYTGATVSTNKDYVGLTLQNQTASSPHTTTLTITGLNAGTYPVTVGGASAGTVTVTSGQPVAVPLPVGTAVTYAVTVGKGCAESTGGTDGGDGYVDAGSGGQDGGSGSSSGGPADAGSYEAGADATVPAGDGSAGGANGAEAGSGGCGCSTPGEHQSGGPGEAMGALVGLVVAVAGRARRRRVPATVAIPPS